MLTSKRYSVLVVDPPWSYGKDTGRTRTAESHYQTLGKGDGEVNRRTGEGVESIIQQTPVCDLSLPDAHLYLWTTNPKLPFAFTVMEQWGFVYKTMLTWVKVRSDGGLHGGGMGWFFRVATEHVLFGVRGVKPIPSSLRRPNVVMAQTTGHSEKPEAFYDLLRSIYPTDEPMVDIYNRRNIAGFDGWGMESPHQNPSSDTVVECLTFLD